MMLPGERWTVTEAQLLAQLIEELAGLADTVEVGEQGSSHGCPLARALLPLGAPLCPGAEATVHVTRGHAPGLLVLTVEGDEGP